MKVFLSMKQTVKTKEIIETTRYDNTFFEESCWQKNELLIGIDEAGRGCLAGPVVVCALVLNPHTHHPLLRDSKLMTEKQRNTAYEWILNNAWYTTAIIDHTFIDTHNIYQATLYGMRRAFYQLISHPLLSKKPTLVVVDAMPLKVKDSISINSFIKGESKSISIAAASIVAKVTRDNLMQSYHTLFPSYELDGHKGYGSEKHRMILTEKGSSIIHRATFSYKKVTQTRQEDKNYEQQSSLFC